MELPRYRLLILADRCRKEGAQSCRSYGSSRFWNTKRLNGTPSACHISISVLIFRGLRTKRGCCNRVVLYA